MKVQRSFPRIFSHDELSRLYDACETCTYPMGIIPAPDWWRSLLVLAYNIGARTSDLLSMETDAVDWNKGSVRFLQNKVQAWHFVPLTEPARLHLERIWSPRSLIFPGGPEFIHSKKFYRNWRELLRIAGFEEHVEGTQTRLRAVDVVGRQAGVAHQAATTQ